MTTRATRTWATTASATPFVLGPDETKDVDAGVLSRSRFGSVEGTVFCDLGRDGTSLSEPGVTGVAVHLLDADRRAVQDTVSGPLGVYRFHGVSRHLPGPRRDLRELGFFFTAQNAGGDDAVDSDADPVTRRAGPVTVVAGQHDDRIDAGYTPTGAGRSGSSAPERDGGCCDRAGGIRPPAARAGL